MLKIYKSIMNVFRNNSKVKIQKGDKKKFFIKKDTLGYMDHEDVDYLSKIFVSWYKLKVPDNVLNTKDNDFSINNDSANYTNYKNMTFDKLLDKNKNLVFLKCNYYDNNNPFSEEDLVLNIFTVVGLFKNRIGKNCIVLVDKRNGKILDIKGDFLLPDYMRNNYKEYNLEKLIDALKKVHNDSLNYNSLVDCVSKRKKDIITRDKLIKKVCLDLLLSSGDDFEYGYYRALFFLNEISSFIDVDYSSDYLLKIINNISDKEKQKKINSSFKLKKIANN